MPSLLPIGPTPFHRHIAGSPSQLPSHTPSKQEVCISSAGVRHAPVQGRRRTFMSSSARCLFWRSLTSSSASCSAALLRSAAASCAASSSICFRRSASRAALPSCRAASSCAASAASCRCRATCPSWLAWKFTHEDHIRGRASHNQWSRHPGCRQKSALAAKLATEKDRQGFLRHTHPHNMQLCRPQCAP